MVYVVIRFPNDRRADRYRNTFLRKILQRDKEHIMIQKGKISDTQRQRGNICNQAGNCFFIFLVITIWTFSQFTIG